MSRVSVVRSSSNVEVNPNVKKDEGRFTFSNGDAYVGGFMIVRDKKFVTRQGHGVYVTEDFNEYKTYWVEDRIVGEAHICYNNGTQYKGTLGVEGEMFGYGVYIFGNKSILRATWDRNKPSSNIILEEPLGYFWKGVSNEKEVAFVATNHFWDEICSPTGNESEEGEETHLDVDSNN